MVGSSGSSKTTKPKVVFLDAPPGSSEAAGAKRQVKVSVKQKKRKYTKRADYWDNISGNKKAKQKDHDAKRSKAVAETAAATQALGDLSRLGPRMRALVQPDVETPFRDAQDLRQRLKPFLDLEGGGDGVAGQAAWDRWYEDQVQTFDEELLRLHLWSEQLREQGEAGASLTRFTIMRILKQEASGGAPQGRAPGGAEPRAGAGAAPGGLPPGR